MASFNYTGTVIMPFFYPLDTARSIYDKKTKIYQYFEPLHFEKIYSTNGSALLNSENPYGKGIRLKQGMTLLKFLNGKTQTQEYILQSNSGNNYYLNTGRGSISFQIRDCKLFLYTSGVGYFTMEFQSKNLSAENMLVLNNKLQSANLKLKLYWYKDTRTEESKASKTGKELHQQIKQFLQDVLDIDDPGKIILPNHIHMLDYVLAFDTEEISDETALLTALCKGLQHVADRRNEADELYYIPEQHSHTIWSRHNTGDGKKVVALTKVSSLSEDDRKFIIVNKGLEKNITNQYLNGFLFYLSIYDLLLDKNTGFDRRILTEKDLFEGIDGTSQRNEIVLFYVNKIWKLPELRQSFLKTKKEIRLSPYNYEIFLASSVKELQGERKEFGDFIREINNLPLFRITGKSFVLHKCEDYTQTNNRQDYINEQIDKCDYMVAIFKRKIGDETKQEVMRALDSHKKTLVFFYDWFDDDHIDENIKEIHDRLEQEKNYACIWKHFDTIKNKVLFQLLTDCFEE